MNSLLSHAGLYHELPKQELERLAHFEVCHFLQKIYLILRNRHQLKPTYPKYVRISILHLLTFYSWKIRLNSEGDIRNGEVGEVTIRSDWAFNKKMRKKAAAFIAAEWYLYYLYSKEGKLNQIYRPVVHGVSVRPSLVMHILKLVGEEKWAYVDSKAILSISKKRQKVDEELAQLLNITKEEALQIERLLRNEITNLEACVKTIGDLDKPLDLSVIERTDVMVNAELMELGNIIGLLEKEIELRKNEERTDLEDDIAQLQRLKKDLIGIQKGIKRWVQEKRIEHKQIRKGVYNLAQIREETNAELQSMRIDAIKIHILLGKLDSEKARILAKIADLNRHLVY